MTLSREYLWIFVRRRSRFTVFMQCSSLIYTFCFKAQLLYYFNDILHIRHYLEPYLHLLVNDLHIFQYINFSIHLCWIAHQCYWMRIILLKSYWISYWISNLIECEKILFLHCNLLERFTFLCENISLKSIVWKIPRVHGVFKFKNTNLI